VGVTKTVTVGVGIGCGFCGTSASPGFDLGPPTTTAKTLNFEKSV
jgi:hypothetical protein